MASPPLHTSDVDIVNLYNELQGVSAVGGGAAAFVQPTLGICYRDPGKPGWRLERPGVIAYEAYVDSADNRLHIAGGPVVFESNPIIKGGQPWFDVKAYGALGDGSTDDTTAINNTFAQVPATGGVVYFPSGTYIVDAGTIGSTATGLVIKGAGRDATTLKVKNGAGGGKVIDITGAARAEVRDLTMDGNYANNAAVAITLIGANSTSQNGLRILDARFTNNNYVAVETTGRSDVLVTGCQFDGQGTNAQYTPIGAINNFVGVPPAARPARQVVTNCYFRDIHATGGPAGIAFGRCDDVRVVNCLVYNCDTGVALEHCRYSTVAGNVTELCDQAGIRMSNADAMSASDILDYYNTVVGNVCRGATTFHGIALRGNRMVCSGNICQGNTGSGIDINAGPPAVSGPAYTSKYLTITGNQSDGNGVSGINLQTYSGGSGAGVISEITLASNTCQGNVSGINLTENASGDITDVTLVGNDLRGNTNSIGGTAAVRTRSTVYIFDNPAFAQSLMLSTANTTATNFSNVSFGYEVDDGTRPGFRWQRTGQTSFEALIDTDNVLKIGNAIATSVLIDTNGKLTPPASATGSAGLRLIHGAAPTSPVDGDMWSTTAGLFIRINGVTKTVTLT